MRALVGGLIGAVVSTAAWLGIEHVQHASYGWMVVLIGLVTGFCVHKCGEGNSGGFARGALAIILTLAGIAGGRWGYAQIMQASSTAAEVAVAGAPRGDATAEEEDAADDAATEAATSTAEAVELSGETPGVGNRGYSKAVLKKNLSEMDMVWMCVAALAAYVVGKGSDEPSSVTVDEAPVAPPQEMPENDAE